MAYMHHACQPDRYELHEPRDMGYVLGWSFGYLIVGLDSD